MVQGWWQSPDTPWSPWYEPPLPQRTCSFLYNSHKSRFSSSPQGQAWGTTSLRRAHLAHATLGSQAQGALLNRWSRHPPAPFWATSTTSNASRNNPFSAKHWGFHGHLNSQHCLLVSLPQTRKQNYSRTMAECLPSKNSFSYSEKAEEFSYF